MTSIKEVKTWEFIWNDGLMLAEIVRSETLEHESEIDKENSTNWLTN